MSKTKTISLDNENDLWLQTKPRSFNFSELVNNLIRLQRAQDEVDKSTNDDKFKGFKKVMNPDGSFYWVEDLNTLVKKVKDDDKD